MLKRVIFRSLIVAASLFALYTLYSLFFPLGLCDLSKVNPKTTAFMEIKKDRWEDKNRKRKIDHRWVPLSAISRNLRNAVIVTEDPNFYSHIGVDLYAIWLATKANVEEGEIVSGASTITQQLAKNLYLSPSRNPFRKWREAILAVRLERCLAKKRILELYLNVIEWGETAYGAEAASRRYFGKSAASLSSNEAALLAAMIRNPVALNPYRRNSRLIKIKNNILLRMLRAGMISKGEYQGAVNQYVDLR